MHAGKSIMLSGSLSEAGSVSLAKVKGETNLLELKLRP